MNADLKRLSPELEPGQHGRGAVVAGEGDGISGSALDLRSILGTVWRRKWLIAAIVLLVIGVTVILTALADPTYRATATVEISQPEAQVVDGGESESIAVRDPQFLATQLGLLQSRALAERVAATINSGAGGAGVLGAAREAIVTPEQILEGLDVNPVETSRLISVSFVSEQPELAARVPNLTIENFIEMNLQRRYNATASARNFLEGRISSVRQELESAERELVNYARDQGIVLVGGGSEAGGEGETSLDSESLVSLNEELAEAQSQRIATEQRFRQAARTGSPSEAVNNSTIQGLITERARVQAERAQLLTQFTPEYPQIVALQERIDELTDQIESQRTAVVTSMEGEYRAAAAREGALRGRVNQLREAVLDLRGRSVQYNILQRDVDTSRTLYEGLLQRYKEVGIAGGIGASTAAVVDPAQVPQTPYSPDLLLNIFMALIAGGFLGFLAAFVVDYFNDRIRDPADVRARLGIDTIGTVPLNEDDEDLVAVLKDPKSPVSEAYSSIRAVLQFSTTTGVPRTLSVTSTRPGEGKSSTSYAIASQLARLGRNVLLVDADMRKPTFKVDMGRSSGLAGVLTGSTQLADALIESDQENLSLLPVGEIPMSPTDLLSGRGFGVMLSEAEKMFDHVIIDSPPMLGLADAQLIGSSTAATAFVIEANGARAPSILTAIQRLKSSGANVIGAVVTKLAARSSAYGYGYGYEYATYSYGGGGEADKGRSIPITRRTAA